MNLKSISHNRAITYIIALIIVCYIKLVKFTSKTIYINIDNLHHAKNRNNNIIFAFWHGREFMMPCYLQKQGNMFSVISNHKDGEFATIVIESFGSTILRGSSNKGGSSVIRKILKEFKKPNNHLCITPDGPRGPRMEVSGAVTDIAKLSGAVILPVTYSAKKAKLLNSWDRFMLPKLFNHITLEFGEIITVDRKSSKTDIDLAKKKLENSLNKMTWKLDKNYGREKIKTGIIKKKNDTDI